MKSFMTDFVSRHTKHIGLPSNSEKRSCFPTCLEDTVFLVEFSFLAAQVSLNLVPLWKRPGETKTRPCASSCLAKGLLRFEGVTSLLTK